MFIDQEQIKAIMTNFLKNRGRRGASIEELEKVVNQLSQDYMLGICASLVLQGKVAVDYRDGQILYRKVG